jgi:hypothetical protein
MAMMEFGFVDRADCAVVYLSYTVAPKITQDIFLPGRLRGFAPAGV